MSKKLRSTSRIAPWLLLLLPPACGVEDDADTYLVGRLVLADGSQVAEQVMWKQYSETAV